MDNMKLMVKNIVAIALSGIAIFGCLVLFIVVTRSREVGQREGDNTTDFPSVFEKVDIFTPRIPY